METLKTAVVVVVLLGILYGVYMVLNKPDPVAPPADVAWQAENAAPPQVQLGTPTSPESLSSLSEPTLAPPPAGEPAGADSTPAADAASEPADAPPRDGQASKSEPARVAPPSRLPPEDEVAPLGAPATKLASANMASAPPDSAANSADRERSEETPGPGTVATRSLNLRDTAEVPATRTFDTAWRTAIAQMQRQEWPESLLTLSLFYHDPELSGDERQRLVDLLDPLAGKVIYSTEHCLLRPHVVRPGETLEQVAQRYRVSPTLLQNVNGIVDPLRLQPGSRLKVVQGPFRAEVDLKNHELVVFLGKFYAGRFPVTIGNDPPPKPADYEVQGQGLGREYVAANGARIPAGAPDNPFGNAYLDLGGGTAIHGSPETASPSGSSGCISLDPSHAADVYAILTPGSKVLIR